MQKKWELTEFTTGRGRGGGGGERDNWSNFFLAGQLLLESGGFLYGCRGRVKKRNELEKPKVRDERWQKGRMVERVAGNIHQYSTGTIMPAELPLVYLINKPYGDMGK